MTIAPSANHSPTPSERHRRVEGTYNLRDVGGYRTLDSAGQVDGVTRWGRLFRSDALHRLTDTSRGTLAELGIRTIVDLRDESELLSSPSRIDGLAITVVHEPIFTGDPTRRVTGDVTLDSLYRSIVTDFGHNLAAAVGDIARAADEPVLVHCTAGKDRTGLVVALALLAVGVDREDVLGDYAQTEENLSGEWAEEMLSQMVSSGVDVTPELTAIISASPRRLMADTLDLIEEEWGSAQQYLIAHGLDSHDLDELRFALVVPEKGSES
jgi:protein-tyrosine phosphatase